jgi:hypothetical protein
MRVVVRTWDQTGPSVMMHPGLSGSLHFCPRISLVLGSRSEGEALSLPACMSPGIDAR